MVRPARNPVIEQENPSNEELLRRYQGADPEAFTLFFERTHRVVFHFLLSKLRNQADAEEALQRTYFKIHRYILTYDPNRNAISWTFAIARRVALDVVASRPPVQALNDEEVPGDGDSLLSTKVAQQELHVLLSSLSGKDRELIERRYLLEQDFEEIAKSQGLTAVNVRQRVSRVMRRLRTHRSRH